MLNFIRVLIACVALGLSTASTFALNRQWNPYAVTGAVSGTGNVCRLTIAPAIVGGGLTAANLVTTTSITGATGCNVTDNAITIVDTTHIELTGTTFGGVFAAGGCVAGGNWTSTNTANWTLTSIATCGSGGVAAPTTGDTVLFDANSLTSLVVCDPSISGLSLLSLTGGASSVRLDCNANGPINMSFSVTGGTNGLTWAGTGANRWIKLNGTYTLTTSGSYDFGTTTNADLANTSFVNAAFVLNSNAYTSQQSFAGGSRTYLSLTVNGRATGQGVNIGGSNTFGSLILNGPSWVSNAALTQTITSALTVAGSGNSFVTFGGPTSANQLGTFAVAGATVSIDRAILRNAVFTGATPTATNSYDLGGNSGVTITAPSAGGGGSRCIGC